jgi:hypothetical protein
MIGRKADIGFSDHVRRQFSDDPMRKSRRGPIAMERPALFAGAAMAGAGWNVHAIERPDAPLMS